MASTTAFLALVATVAAILVGVAKTVGMDPKWNKPLALVLVVLCVAAALVSGELVSHQPVELLLQAVVTWGSSIGFREIANGSPEGTDGRLTAFSRTLPLVGKYVGQTGVE